MTNETFSPKFDSLGHVNQTTTTQINTYEDRFGEMDKAEQLERIATAAMQGIVSSIHSEADYHRLKFLAEQQGMTKVSEWIAKDSIKQAKALINELNK